MTPSASERLAQAALEAFLAGLSAVDPTKLVKARVRGGDLDDLLGDRHKPETLHVLAAGKAAGTMVWGLIEAKVPFRGIGIIPQETRVPDLEGLRWHRGEHPVPGEGSLAAGEAVLEWAASLPDDAPVLVLLSGGASSLMEVFTGDADDGMAAWRDDLTDGLDIARMNGRRAQRSRIKGGRLGRAIQERTRHARVWILADTPPDDAPATVASGPCWTGEAGVPHAVLASAEEMLAGAAQSLAADGWQVFRHPSWLAGDAEETALAFVDSLSALPEGRVALLGAGETTVALPPDAPPGGRCQHAALAAAQHLPDRAVLAALASDGVDGTTREAGAWSDASLWDDQAAAALAGCDAHDLLAARDRTIRTGATGTNVNDLWVLLRP